MRAKEYPLLCRVVEEGLRQGWRDHFKHEELEPSPATREPLLSVLEEAVLNALCEAFDLDDRAPEKFDG